MMQRIRQVSAGQGYTLHLEYSDGATFEVDLSGLLEGDAGVFEALRDRATFEGVRVGSGGRSVAWDDDGDLELDADTLRMPDGHPDKPPLSRVLSSTAALPSKISLELARALRDSGLTRKQLEQKSGIRQPNLSRLFSPDYSGHSLATLERLAEAMNLELEVRLKPRNETPPRRARSYGVISGSVLPSRTLNARMQKGALESSRLPHNQGLGGSALEGSGQLLQKSRMRG